MNSGCRKHGSSYRFWLGIVLGLLVAVPASAQQVRSDLSGIGSGEASAVPSVQPADTVHRFWDRKNLWLFSGVAAARGLDYASTYNMLDRGRQEILLPDEVVNNRAGFAALEAAGTATSIGLSYLLHRTGHHQLERWLSISHIGVAGFGAARNYALETKHP
jgi:hypothetical protein